MELLMLFLRVMLTVALLGLISVLFKLCDALALKPRRLRSILQKQSISGPTPSFLLGNIPDMVKKQPTVSKPPQEDEDKGMIHNCPPLIFPHLVQWSKEYGPKFVFSLGNIPFLYLNEPEVLKEFSKYTPLNIGKPCYVKAMFDPLVGTGIAHANGTAWAHQRKLIAPEFFMDKVKGMTKLMVESAATTVVKPWHSLIEIEGGVADVIIDNYMTNFSRNVISRLCFGNNHSEGEQIFLKLKALEEIMSKQGPLYGAFPMLRYIPTESNRETSKLKKESRALILKMINERKDKTTDKDLLQLILEAAEKSGLSKDATESFVVDNCKTMYLAGYDTTASSAMWVLMLLASNPIWQAKAREEVLQICGGQMPDNEMLPKMKTLTMVIQESLRLYPPAPVITREALEDVKFCGVHVPKGVNIWILTIALHYDPEIWGPDVNKFNPERFANGVSGSCKLPHVYVPFGAGPRVCLGQHFAMAELKILLALILSNFSFSLSPKYKHSPVIKVVMGPKDGMNLIIRKL
ncbi:cytochrome P450 714C2 [Ziziphus jujuba]|uniref:Cytochrome P450 714C2 n=1 Tax=Ziziphus jujuba TaxID=326968 RepID=A0A6P3ZAQ2_ZIZJJ|nr:cytochrome P450 714C2 [Ziziphus jujuba]